MAVDPVSLLAGGLIDIRPAVGSIVEGGASVFSALLGQRQQAERPAPESESPSSTELPPLLTGPHSVTGVQLQELRALTDAAADRFHAEVGRVLAEHGLAPQQPYALGSDAFGRLEVQGGHPQKSAIEAALAAEPELADAFAQIASSAGVLRAAGGDVRAAPEPRAATFSLRMLAERAEIAFV